MKCSLYESSRLYCLDQLVSPCQMVIPGSELYLCSLVLADSWDSILFCVEFFFKISSELSVEIVSMLPENCYEKNLALSFLGVLQF